MGDNEMSLTCGHCHQEVIALERVSYRYVYDPPVGVWVEWRIAQCGACTLPILLQLGSEDDYIPDYKPTILYPVQRLATDVLPPSVNKAYQNALAVQWASPSACAVMIGRTLEMVCHEQNVQGRNLAAKLEMLAADGRLPPVLAEMAKRIRVVRNFGAHADEDDELTTEDASTVMDFLEAILEYIYIAPQKIKRVEFQLHRKR